MMEMDTQLKYETLRDLVRKLDAEVGIINLESSTWTSGSDSKDPCGIKKSRHKRPKGSRNRVASETKTHHTWN